jgi:cytochrome c-type biogenesis protein CcmI
MSMWLMVAGLVIALLTGLYIFWPYFEPEERRRAAFVGRDPKETLMDELAQLEYDFRSGKIRPEDYEQLRADLEARLLRLRAQGDQPEQEQEEVPQDARGDAGAA